MYEQTIFMDMARLQGIVNYCEDAFGFMDRRTVEARRQWANVYDVWSDIKDDISHARYMELYYSAMEVLDVQ